MSLDDEITSSYNCVILAVRLKATGNIDAAEEKLHEALLIYKENAHAYEELIDLRVDQGRLSEALAYC